MTIKQICLSFILLVISFSSTSSTVFLDIDYDSAAIKYEKRGWLSKLFTDEEQEVAVIITVFKKVNSNGIIVLSSPQHAATLQREGKTIRSTYKTNIPILTNEAIASHERLILKIEFFSLEEQQLTAFSKGIESLAQLYASAASPALSPTLLSVVDGFVQLVNNDENIYITKEVGLDASKSQAYPFFFNKEGEEVRSVGGGKPLSNAEIVFKVKSKPRLTINWDNDWSQQPYRTDKENALFNDLKSATTHADRKIACQNLRTELNSRLPGQASEDLIAIAIETIKWAQDDTLNNCMTVDKAKDYKKKHPSLEHLVLCEHQDCFTSKLALNHMVRKSSPGFISRLLGVTDLSVTSACYKDIKEVKAWSDYNFETFKDAAGEYSVFIASTKNINTQDQMINYRKTLTLENGKLTKLECVLE